MRYAAWAIAVPEVLMFGSAVCLPGIPTTFAANQTATVSPVQDGGLGFSFELRELDMGATPVPTLHSFAAGEYDGKWIIIGGRTKQTWGRSIVGAAGGFDDVEIASLSTANNQFEQVGDTLYMTGGYGVSSVGSGFDFTTFDLLTAVDLPGLARRAYREAARRGSKAAQRRLRRRR